MSINGSETLSDFIFLDFETAFSSKDKYSLKHLTYEQYIRDERFRVHGLGYKVNDGPTQYVVGDQVFHALSSLFPSNNGNILVAHNTLFDGAILSWIYGLRASTYYCTESMSRACWNQHSAALASVAERCFPDNPALRKGKELANFDGILRELTPAEQMVLGGYCIQDVDLTFHIFGAMYKWLPNVAFDILNIALQAFIHPAFVLDRSRVKRYLVKINEERQNAIKESGLDEKVLASNDQFAAWILEQGIPFEKVPSPTPKNPSNEKWPLAKTATEFVALQTDYPEFSKVWDARLAVKSTIEKTRSERLLDHAKPSPINPRGLIALPLAFCSAHTKRFGGTNKVNAQNFSRGSELRKSLCAPDGMRVGVGDLSNVEARVLAWLARCSPLLRAFATGVDFYCVFATKVFGRPITKDDYIERLIGKVCILGLGFGMSFKTLRKTLAQGAMGGPRLHFTTVQCKNFVDTYRYETCPEIPLYWRKLDKMLYSMCFKDCYEEDRGIIFEYQRVTLPNGMVMNYPDLTCSNQDDGKFEFTYWNGDYHTKIYGGKFAENLTQAIAQAILWEQMVAIQEYLETIGGRIMLQVHDEIVFLVPVEVAEEALEHVLYLMRKNPPWVTDELVLDAEGGLDVNYSK